MSVKRQATKDLNHENWNDEDPEDDKDMGQFKAASKDILEKRVIRTAKRRNPISSEGKKSVFSGFGGFNKAQPASFDFLANLTNGSKNTNGSTSTSNPQTSSTGLFTSKPTASSSSLFGVQSSTSLPQPSQPAMTPSPFGTAIKTTQSTLFTTTNVTSSAKETPFKIQPVSNTTQVDLKFGVSTAGNESKQLFTSTPVKPQTSSTTSAMVQTTFGITSAPTMTSVTPEKKTEGNEKTNEKKIKYFSKLKGLNEAVSDWISKHVAQTPLCILSPIFKDYEKYLKEITEEYQSIDKGAADNMDVEKSVPKTGNVQNTKISFASNNTGSSPFTSNSSSENAKTSVPFGISNSNASLPKIGTSNQDIKTTPFGATNPGSSPLTSQNTKISSPFAMNNSASPSSSENIKKSAPFSMNNTNSSPLTSPKSSTPSAINKIGSSPLNSQERKSPFGTTNNNTASSSSTPSNATPKPIFGVQNNLVSSSENKPTFSFGINTSNTITSSSSTPTTGFSFGVTTSAASTSSPFLLSTNVSTNQTSTAPFSFGIGKPFAFSPNTLAQQPSSEITNANEEDNPPKVEYTPVKEDNSVYEKKCKIFVKKDGNFVDKGVGTLYIKKIEGNVKHQLLVRANTNLGKVLLNLVLAEAIPTQRMGKNNVMLVCIPTPDAKPPPTPVLIRVKTGEEADEVLETLKKYKA